MITILFTETRLVAYGLKSTKSTEQLVSAELAGRSHPMTSTLHVFLNTIINRYKDFYPNLVRYPIELNIIFPTQSYLNSAEQKHLIDYILDRKDVIRLAKRKSLMEAVVRGWQKQNKKTADTWMAMEISKNLTIGVKAQRIDPLLIKQDPQIGSHNLLEEIKNWAGNESNPQSSYLLDRVMELDEGQVQQIFNTYKFVVKFSDSQELPISEIKLEEEFIAKILQIISNRIFLHINNCNSKLPNNKFVYILGSFTNHEAIQSTLREKASKSDYQTVFIPAQKLALLATQGMHSDEDNSTSSTEQARLSTLANDTSTYTQEVSNDSSPQSSRFTQITNSKTPSVTKVTNGKSLFSNEFIVEQRIPDQEFMLFKGFRRGIETKQLYRYVDHDAYKSLDRAAAFNSIYRKERKLYSNLGSVVNGRSGKYYILPSIKGNSLKEVIQQSRLNIGSEKNFKSEDLQFILDLYRAIKNLPVTFKNLTPENIYVRRRDWWRRNSLNEFYFLGVTSENSSIDSMIKELDKLLQSLIHPTIIDHITNFKNEI